MQSDFDVFVVGARIGGSMAATLLAQASHRVLGVGRARFPRDTFSTHFFHCPGFNALGKLDVLDEVHTLVPALIGNLNDVDGLVFAEPMESPDGPSYYLCVRRITLDEILVRRMRQEATLSFREGVRVIDLLAEDSTVTGVDWSEHGEHYSATARVAIGADGFPSIVAKKVNAPAEGSEPIRRAMYYAYYANFEPREDPAAEFHYRGTHLVYVFPTSAAVTLLAASVPIEDFPALGQEPEQQLRLELESMQELARRLHRAERVGPVKGARYIPVYQRRPFGLGWALARDSEQVMDPWSGQGIDQASTPALILVKELNRWLA